MTVGHVAAGLAVLYLLAVGLGLWATQKRAARANGRPGRDATQRH